MNRKLILKEKDDIMIRYLQLRKIAISYWNYFAFAFGNVFILPLINKTRIQKPIIQVFITLCISFEFYKFSLKYFVKTFNNKEYNIYKEYCAKYGLYDNMLNI